MLSLTDCKSQLKCLVHDLIDKANRMYGLSMAYPTIRYTLSGTTAGKAYYKEWMVNFQPVLMVENWQDFLDETIAHEVSHLVCHARHGIIRQGRNRSIHGYAWKQIMRDLGYNPQRTHSYDTSNCQSNRGRARGTRMERPFVYKCDCQEHHLTQIQHRRMKYGYRGRDYKLRCRRCKTPIEYMTTEIA